MDCIYNTGGMCYFDDDDVKECYYIGSEQECEKAEEE